MDTTRVKVKLREQSGRPKFFHFGPDEEFQEVVLRMNQLFNVKDLVPADRDGALYTGMMDFKADDLVYLEPKDSPPPQELDSTEILKKLFQELAEDKSGTISLLQLPLTQSSRRTEERKRESGA